MAEAAFTGARSLAPTGFSPDLSRRQMFAGTGLALGAAALASIPTATALQISDRAVRAAWDRTMSRMLAAEQAERDYDLQVYDPLYKKLQRVAPRPSLHFEVTARSGEIARYHIHPDRLHEWHNHIIPTYREKAAAVRDAWLAHVAVKDRLGLHEIEDESQRRQDVRCDLESELMVMPAPDRSALLWKLEHLFGPSGRAEDEDGPSYCPEWINALMRDARRFLST